MKKHPPKRQLKLYDRLTKIVDQEGLPLAESMQALSTVMANKLVLDVGSGGIPKRKRLRYKYLSEWALKQIKRDLKNIGVLAFPKK